MSAAELQRYTALRAKALAVKPDPKPGTITVAVFREPEDSKDVNIDELDDESFLWLRCSSKTTLSVIQENCIKNFAENVVPPCELELFLLDVPVHVASNVGVFNTYGDDLVLLSAKPVNPTEQTSLPAGVPIKAEQKLAAQEECVPPGPSGPYPPIVAPHPQPDNLFDGLMSYAERDDTPEAPISHIKHEHSHPDDLIVYPPDMQANGMQPPYVPNQYHPNQYPPDQYPLNQYPPNQHSPNQHSPHQHLPHQIHPNQYPPIHIQAPQPLAVKHEDQEMKYDLGGPADMQDDDSEDGQEVDQKPKPATNVQLQQLFEETDMKTLEKGIEKGLLLLDKLKDALASDGHATEEVNGWVKQIEDIKKQAQYHRTIVGVVGNTGAGKSSVINALLEEERLVPTNCMRACTAVVTEISYNGGDEGPYRASIEFITAAEWERELRVLFQDLMDGSGEVKTKISAESESGIAWAKIKGVYPKKTKEMLGQATVESLLAEQPVKNILGTNRIISETDSLRFYKKLQRFVDSNEKSMGDKKDRDKKIKEMEYWPLIRVVKLYVKSPTLATGAVIVDLPGVHDANAARAAVAESYMQRCTGLWIVAPINRAVDDKSAHKLLGESFRRQLLMDGAFSTVSFICSKSDDISVSEAMLSLNLDDELSVETEELEELEKERSEKKRTLKCLQGTRQVYMDAQEEVDELLTTYEELKDKFDAGEEVYAPEEREQQVVGKNSKKRKRENSKGKKPKKSKRSSDHENSDFIVSDDEADEISDNNSDKESEEDREPLTLEDLHSKIEELRVTKKSGREEKQKITKEILEIRAEVSDLDKRIKKLENKIASYCILARNKYSTGAIQNDFASGLEELDREAAEDVDGENFDPEAQLRDYTEVANQLPVFCVSSRGYQKLKGRLKKDGDPPVFENVDQTGIPALQAHCTKLTEKGRSVTARKFLTNLSQLCNSLSLWSTSDGTANHLTDTQKAKEVRTLDGKFKKLDKRLDEIILQTVNELKAELADNILDRYSAAIDAAASAAPATAEKWGHKVNREDYSKGGYYWATYKAICRRNGEFSNSRGKHDMNGQLSDPMIKILASNWEKTFARRLPSVLQEYFRLSKDAITSFHQEVEKRARKTGMGAASLHVLSGQLNTYGDVFRGVATEIAAEINVAQREINREFTPVIAAVMATAYDYCTRESGPGSFARMRHGMEEHVQRVHRTMFEQSTGEVKRRLTDMIKMAENKLEETTAQIFNLLERDYRSIFGGNPKQFSGGRLSREEDKLRGIVREALVGFEDDFKKVAEGNSTPTPELEGGKEMSVEGAKGEDDNEDSEWKESASMRSTTVSSASRREKSRNSVDVGGGQSEGDGKGGEN